jgi:hypothetical protein
VGAILLVGASGDALTAAQNGRKTFYLHGGPSDRKGRLRPTRGGFRMLDRDLVSVLVAINEAQLRGDPLEVIEVVDVVLPPGPRAPGERVLTRKRRRRQKRRTKARIAKKVKTGALPPLAPALLLAAKLLGDRKPNVRASVSRRDLMALAVLITGVAGCGRRPRRVRERPSSCAPVACDPNEGLCPPPPAECFSGGGGGWDGTGDDTGGDG